MARGQESLGAALHPAAVGVSANAARAAVDDTGSLDGLLTGFYWPFKRCFGLIGALTFGLATLPVLILISLILAHQGRPVIITRRRLGRHGKPFNSYYFRTMVPDSLRALQQGERHGPAQDGFGRFLKRTRLDHLPLLWNVLRGDMNLVGPRPLSQEELMGSGRAARHTLSVRPGLTGLWWTEGEHDLRRRLALDRGYIEHASPLLDLRIVLLTALRMHSTGLRPAPRSHA